MIKDTIRQIWPDLEIYDTPLGKGSFGKVYKAVRRDHGVEVFSAIKVISVPKDSTDIDTFRAQGLDWDDTEAYFHSKVNELCKEIGLMAEFKSAPNIVSIEDYKVVKKEDEIGWIIFIKMELLTSLDKYLCKKTMQEREVIQLGIDMCSALEICHSRNIIHRDIKPQNILVTNFDTFKLGDFGVARKLDHKASNYTRIGAPNYIAPEVYHGRSYDHRADIYSLGVVLYCLLNGNRLPFLDDNKHPLTDEDLRQAFNTRIYNLEDLPPPSTASTKMAELVLRACAYDPEDRFSSAREMKDALNGIVNPEADESEEGYKPPKVPFPAPNGAPQNGGEPGTILVNHPPQEPNPETPTPGGDTGHRGDTDPEKTKVNWVLMLILVAAFLAGLFWIFSRGGNTRERDPAAKYIFQWDMDSPEDEAISKILSDAETLASKQDYEGAVNVIEDGLITHHDSEKLQSKAEEYRLALNLLKKEAALTEAAEFAKAGDYPAALKRLQNVPEQQADDNSLQNTYTTYSIAYETEVNSKVDACLEENELYNAEKILIDALEVLPDSKTIQAKKQEIDGLLKQYENEWEAESNNTFQNANKIWLDKLYFGTLEAKFELGEQDWYVFTLDSPSCVTLAFNSEMQQFPDYYWDINIRSEKDPAAHLWQKYVSGTTTRTQSPMIALAAGTYYVEIESSEKYSSDTYSFSVTLEERTENWEMESNNSFQAANEIIPNQEYFGVLHRDYKKEQDWFTFFLQEPGEVYLLFNSAFQSNDSYYWDVSIRSGSNPENKLWQKYIKGQSVNTQSDILTLAAGKYYVEIESSDVHSTDMYSFTLTFHTS